ncbi:ABC transporter substrate-binding protein [Desulfonema magnum]|nr:ABC transporter substrate binding protein [Desulfonema magnum]
MIKIISKKLLCLLFLFLLLPGLLSADDKRKIMVINSDASVEKYREVQEEFHKAISYPIPVTEIRLEDRRRTISEIDALLDDKDYCVVYCIGTKAYLIANKYADEKPVIFSSVINWLRLPVTERTYGVSNELHTGMQLMLFRYIFPKIQKLGVLYSRQYTGEWFKKTVEAAKEMNVEIIGHAVSDGNDAVTKLQKLLPDIQAFWLISDPMVMSDKKNLFKILKQCDTKKTPVFSYHGVFAKYGAILVVSADNPTIGRQAAGIAEELLSGRKPAEKVQFPAGSHIILNLKKVKEYGLQYSEDALGSVNQVIE